eukprot:CAMPEP_0117467516 /NCGR_PEP_ID=MMETSP0784-20121206/5697_1 /TAXON_ID=39447 /ORGANISM="" /LENGTH=743 /DNA_ID=CAMNT_0005261489 /DNA_START=48 /DNA_END=2276 /DNA_ORIENTATION=+
METVTVGQRYSLLSFLRVLADGEIAAEELRCRLCEVPGFDPYDTFRHLRGPHQQSWYVAAVDLHAWISKQPHHLAGALLEEIATTIVPFVNSSGELRYEGFLRMVLPKATSNGHLKEASLMRGSQVPPHNGGQSGICPETAYRLCQLFENEVSMNRHLKFYRKSLSEQGPSKDTVLKFLDAGQGACAGMGGLIAPEAMRRTLVDGSQGLSYAQFDALLRRVNPSGACLVAFDDLAKYLFPPMLPYISRTIPSPLHVPRSGNYAYDVGGFSTPSPPNRASASLPLSPKVGSDYSAFDFTPKTARRMSPSRYYDCSSPYTPTPVRARALSPLRDGKHGDWKTWMSPSSDRKNGFASTQASTADPISPRSPSPSTARDRSRDWEMPGSLWREDQDRWRRSSSSPPGTKPHAAGASLNYASTPRADRDEIFNVVLRALMIQAEGTLVIEDAKAMLPTCAFEEVFSMLDRYGKGYIADTDLWLLTKDFGGQASFSSLVALINEVQLFAPANKLSTPGRLSLRELCLLLEPLGSPLLESIRDCTSDAEAKSVLYIMRNSEPCPSCGIRVQRSADSAGCPNVRCPVCFASFRCHCVVGDLVLPEKRNITTNTASLQYSIFNLVDVAAHQAANFEADRRRLSLLPGYNLSALSDVFTSLAGGHFSLRSSDLRRQLYLIGMSISERALRTLWHRLSPTGGADVSFSDFAVMCNRGQSLDSFHRQQRILTRELRGSHCHWAHEAAQVCGDGEG